MAAYKIGNHWSGSLCQNVHKFVKTWFKYLRQIISTMCRANVGANEIYLKTKENLHVTLDGVRIYVKTPSMYFVKFPSVYFVKLELVYFV